MHTDTHTHTHTHTYTPVVDLEVCVRVNVASSSKVGMRLIHDIRLHVSAYHKHT